ncbi:permease [Anaerotignum sp. MB30-C6]|uniref:permease n=1 Tax=Anaerotignum sp. MB30-C6 TaxID=3070814 RepID=UPI0027DD6AAA|nr:permease [Anaerotignum sp. MB30-C6]WMI79781.1 permease [Anaerotignum sp. MB30-C6]
MKILEKVKDNTFLIVITVAYILMFLIKPDLGVASMENSVYYIKEMILIMPVIFILTALLDAWIAKEKITKYLGKESKVKGITLSFVLGCISAGPIYAAFPMCVMLHKKGASVRNLVIILSSWAVIKVPMLLNEAKFLGIKFMAIRWVLTVIAIVVFSWIASKIIKDEDIGKKEEKTSGLTLNRESCMGCTLCTKNYPEIFGMQGKKAYIKSFDAEVDKESLSQTILACPVRAIHYNE